MRKKTIYKDIHFQSCFTAFQSCKVWGRCALCMPEQYIASGAGKDMQVVE